MSQIKTDSSTHPLSSSSARPSSLLLSHSHHVRSLTHSQHQLKIRPLQPFLVLIKAVTQTSCVFCHRYLFWSFQAAARLVFKCRGQRSPWLKYQIKYVEVSFIVQIQEKVKKKYIYNNLKVVFIHLHSFEINQAFLTLKLKKSHKNNVTVLYQINVFVHLLPSVFFTKQYKLKLQINMYNTSFQIKLPFLNKLLGFCSSSSH